MKWGPEITPEGTRFTLWAPDAGAVAVETEAGSADMAREPDGWWSATLPANPGTRYRFHIGDTAVPDPAAGAQIGGVQGWSVVVDHHHDWQIDWRGRPWHETVLAAA